MTVSSVLLHTPTKVRSDETNVEEQQQCRILECYHNAFISSSNFDHNRSNHNELTTISCENMGRDLILEEEEDDLLPPTLARLWSYNDDNKVGGMNQSINQVADSLIPEIDDDGSISESLPDVLDQECNNEDSYEVQIEDLLIPEIDDDESRDVLDQCINDESYEVEKILLEIQLSSSASDVFEPGVEIAQTPPKKSSVFDCDLSPVSVTTFDIAPTPPITQSETFVDSVTSAPSPSTARQEEATTIQANAMALLESADRVDPRVSSPVQDTTIQIAPVSFEGSALESAVSCSLTADSTISIVDGTTPPTSMIRPQLCDSQQEMPQTPTEIEESCSVFTSLFGMAGPPSPSPSILISSTDEDIHIGDAEPESFECVKCTTSKVITPLRRFEVETVESAANCSLTADSSISIDDATPPSSVIRRQSCDRQQNMMPSTAMENEESCSVFSFLFGSCSSPPSPSPSILVSSTDEDIGIVDANSESFECVLHEFLNGKRSVTKVTPPNASPSSRETSIIVDTNENLSPIRPPHVGRILDVGAKFNPAKQQADMRNVVGSGGKVRVKNDLSWIKKT
jgi:hypothetical protein